MKTFKMNSLARPAIYFAALCVILLFMATHCSADSLDAAAGDGDKPVAAVQSPDRPITPEEAGIDWMEKMEQGGWTMVALAVLSVVSLVFVLERSLAVRRKHVAPDELVGKVHKAIQNRDTQAAIQSCDQHPSVLGVTLRYIFEHKSNPVEVISAGAGDIAGREVRNMHARTYPLAVIASLAPLLGLLGTMIGMIEAFDKVAYYGDDANASLLADSISKALITTAVGLILAIPAIAVYHFFKYRINGLSGIVENEVDAVINHLYLKDEGMLRPATETPSPSTSQAS